VRSHGRHPPCSTCRRHPRLTGTSSIRWRPAACTAAAAGRRHCRYRYRRRRRCASTVDLATCSSTTTSVLPKNRISSTRPNSEWPGSAAEHKRVKWVVLVFKSVIFSDFWKIPNVSCNNHTTPRTRFFYIVSVFTNVKIKQNINIAQTILCSPVRYIFCFANIAIFFFTFSCG